MHVHLSNIILPRLADNLLGAALNRSVAACGASPVVPGSSAPIYHLTLRLMVGKPQSLFAQDRLLCTCTSKQPFYRVMPPLHNTFLSASEDNHGNPSEVSEQNEMPSSTQNESK